MFADIVEAFLVQFITLWVFTDIGEPCWGAFIISH